jgi:hypothetical protein
MVAEPAVTNASTAAASNKIFFNMFKSPRVFELNSANARIHRQIKSWRSVLVKIARKFRKAEHFQVTNHRKSAFPPERIGCIISGVWGERVSEK